jgi:hypothetical protein
MTSYSKSVHVHVTASLVRHALETSLETPGLTPKQPHEGYSDIM